MSKKSRKSQRALEAQKAAQRVVLNTRAFPPRRAPARRKLNVRFIVVMAIWIVGLIVAVIFLRLNQ
jgi:hypothetical protein